MRITNCVDPCGFDCKTSRCMLISNEFWLHLQIIHIVDLLDWQLFVVDQNFEWKLGANVGVYVTVGNLCF